MLKNIFNRAEPNPSKEQTEYIQYAQEVESTLRLLESQLHESDDAGEIIQNVMKTACAFYQGDWVGFLEVDLEMDLWTPYVWYNPNGNDQTEILLAEVENFEPFKRWLDFMQERGGQLEDGSVKILGAEVDFPIQLALGVPDFIDTAPAVCAAPTVRRYGDCRAGQFPVVEMAVEQVKHILGMLYDFRNL